MKATVSLFVAAGFVLCGCSTFNRDWREAAKDPISTNGIAGQASHAGTNRRPFQATTALTTNDAADCGSAESAYHGAGLCVGS